MIESRTITPVPSELISKYLIAQADGNRLGMWKQNDFVTAFPQITQDIITGKIKVSPDGIRALVSSSLKAFDTLSFSSRIAEEGFLPTGNYNFYQNGKVTSQGSRTVSGIARESLSNANLACVFLLGMKVMKDDKELSREIGKYSHLLKKQRFTHRLFALLSESNAVRGWIIDNELEPQWDTRLATLSCNLHTQALRKKRNIIFPSIIVQTDGAKVYSESSILVYMRYIIKLLTFVNNKGGKLSDDADRQLTDFFHYTLNNMPESFRKRKDVSQLIVKINELAETEYRV